MKEGEGGGEKSEKATPRRLRDARKQGEVAKSGDLSRTATALCWLLLLVLAPGMYAGVAELAQAVLQQAEAPDKTSLLDHLAHAGSVVLSHSLIPIAIVGAVGVIVTRLQIGHVFSIHPILPQFSRLNPANGAKQLFSATNLFEVVKGLVKVCIVAGIVIFVLLLWADDILILIETDVLVFAQLDHQLLVIVLAIACGFLLVISSLDVLFQRFNFLRMMRMSKQEVRRERQSSEGDPHLKGQRRRLQRQWASGNARQSARDASALVVNPTHIAVALFYDPETTPLPLVTAAGEGELAALMRHDAECCGVPVMRSVPLARKLYYFCEDDDEVPELLFDAVAEVLAWADSVRGIANDAACFREADAAFDRMVDSAS